MSEHPFSVEEFDINGKHLAIPPDAFQNSSQNNEPNQMFIRLIVEAG